MVTKHSFRVKENHKLDEWGMHDDIHPVRLAKERPGYETKNCPFCGGDGDTYVTTMVDGNVVEGYATCPHCKGTGTQNESVRR